MMRSARELSEVKWMFEPDSHDGKYSQATLATAAAVESTRLQRAILLALEGISERLDALGEDGIHGLIRAHAKAVREKARRERERKKKQAGARRRRKKT